MQTLLKSELLLRKPNVPMPPGYEVSAFKSAERHFPAGTRFFLNEATQVWTAPQTDACCQIIESYRGQGAKNQITIRRN